MQPCFCVTDGTQYCAPVIAREWRWLLGYTVGINRGVCYSVNGGEHQDSLDINWTHLAGVAPFLHYVGVFLSHKILP